MALELLRILKKSPTLVSPNIQVYNSAIRACAESGDLDRALDDAQAPRTAQLEPFLRSEADRDGHMRTRHEHVPAAVRLIESAAVEVCEAPELQHGAVRNFTFTTTP